MAIKGGNKMKPLKITIPGNPVTKKNHSDFVTIPIKGSTRCPTCKKFYKTMTRLLPSKAYTAYQAEAVGYLPVTPPIEQSVNVKCLYYMGTHRKVDLINLIAATHDILVHYHILADDNSGVIVSVDGSRVLYDKDNPRVEIEISEMV